MAELPDECLQVVHPIVFQTHGVAKHLAVGRQQGTQGQRVLPVPGHQLGDATCRHRQTLSLGQTHAAFVTVLLNLGTTRIKIKGKLDMSNVMRTTFVRTDLILIGLPVRIHG